MANKTDPTPEEMGLNPETVPPETAAETPPETEPKRRRGRPPKDAGATTGERKEGPKKTASRKAEDTDALAHQLVGLHQFAALATGLQELVISEKEGQMLAKGVNAVADEYGLSLSGKTGAALQLIAAAAMIYVPRGLMIKARVEKARREAEIVVN